MALGRLHEAEPLLIEASRESKKVLGPAHDHSRIFAKNLARLRAHPLYRGDPDDATGFYL